MRQQLPLILLILFLFSLILGSSFIGRGLPFHQSYYERQLIGFLSKKRPSKINRALALFDSEDAKSKIPDPRLRAGLCSLYGSSAEAAIPTIMEQASGVVFSPDPCQNEAFAEVDEDEQILVCSNYEASHCAWYGPLLAHEALHLGNDTDSFFEEFFANWIDRMISLEQARDDPSILQDRDLGPPMREELVEFLDTGIPGIFHSLNKEYEGEELVGDSPANHLARAYSLTLGLISETGPKPGQPTFKDYTLYVMHYHFDEVRKQYFITLLNGHKPTVLKQP